MELDFPTHRDDFENDERISYSKLDKKFIAVDDDGNEYEFDEVRKRWLPADSEGEAGDGGASAAAADTRMNEQRKRRLEDAGEDAYSAAPARPKKQPKQPPKPKQNTAVYVTGLPSDATITEIHEVFSRKAGLIAEEIDSHAPRIKLYKDEAGDFKGDALVVFFKPESVRMAIMLLDDTDFRMSATGQGSGKISVQEADVSYKKVQYEQDGAVQPGQQKEVTRKPKNDKDRQKIIKKTQKLDARLAEWSDGEDDLVPVGDQSGQASKGMRTVVLYQMFRIIEIEEDPASLLEIKEDIQEECSKLGTVTNVVLYDQEPEGIVTVKFQTAESAAACVAAMNGRPFDGRIVVATLSNGKDKFRKSNAADNDEADSD